MLKLFALAALVALGAPADAHAAVFDTAANKMGETFQNVKKVVFVVGGFGIVGLAVGAIFGAVKWKWVASLAIGLAMLAAAGEVVNYATGAGKPTGVVDTLT